ncbi:MAG TPA: hypothetical protein VIH58_11845 [Chthoniobacterales bacterium]
MVHQLERQQRETGLNPDQLRERFDKLKELRVMPEDRADTGAE